ERTGGEGAGPADDERRGVRRFIGGDLLLHPVLTIRKALVGGIDNEGVLQLAGLAKGLDDLPHALVDRHHALVELLQPFRMRLAVPGDDLAFGVPAPGLGFFEVTRLARPGPENACGQLGGPAFQGAFVTAGRGGWAVDGAVTK